MPEKMQQSIRALICGTVLAMAYAGVGMAGCADRVTAACASERPHFDTRLLGGTTHVGPGRPITGYSGATGSSVQDQGFGRYSTETGRTLRDTGFGRIRGAGVTLRYQGGAPLRTQSRQTCRVRQTGTVICF